MRMLRMIGGKTPRDGTSNETIHEMTGVKIEEFMCEQRLQWFGHIESIDDERAPVKAKKIVADNSSKKGRPRRHTG